MAHLNRSHTLPMTSMVLMRQGKLIFLVCLISLATLWSCRLPQLCVYDQCPMSPPWQAGMIDNATFLAHRQPQTTEMDLSLADAPFIAWPLARVCNEITAWTPGLVFICDNNSGGIGNIRNFILTCLRYAIEAGATGITMPTIQTRSEENLARLFIGEKRPFSYFFDEQHLRQGLESACPRMKIYDGPACIPGLNKEDLELGKVKPEQITPNHYGLRGGCDQRDLNRHSDLFGSRFRAWLKEKEQTFGLGPISLANPKLIRLNWGVQWNWPVYKDGPEFTATYSGLLKIRADILELGKQTAAAMDRFASLHGFGPASAGFLSLHLRTENDALTRWPNFENQTRSYLQRAKALSPSPRAAYLATGNATEAAKFASRALIENELHVITKHDLLRGHRTSKHEKQLIEQLDALSWDQQALVDFVVLLQSTYFLGVSPSSFSMNIALKRHLKAEGIYSRPWKVGSDEGDARSWLVGNYEAYWEDWLFMYDSLWP